VELEKDRAIKACCLACQEGWIIELKRGLIKEEYFNSPDQTDQNKRTALHRAAENGFLWQIPSEFLSIENMTKVDGNQKSVILTAAKHHFLSTLPDAFIDRLSQNSLLDKDPSDPDNKTVLEYFIEQEGPDNPGSQTYGAKDIMHSPRPIAANGSKPKPVDKEDPPHIKIEKEKRIVKLLRLIPTKNLQEISRRTKTNLLEETIIKRKLENISKEDSKNSIEI
jgi:hypothetical protein